MEKKEYDFGKVFGKRLADARKMRQLSQKALSEATGGNVSSSAIDKYEKGQTIPSTSVLVHLVQALGFNTDYFFTPYTVEVNFDRFEFRKRAKLGAKAIESIKLKVVMKLEKYIQIENTMNSTIQCDLIYQDKLVRTEEDAIDAAHYIRNILRLSDGPVSSPIAMLEEHGVKIIELDEVEEFDGTSNWIDGIPVVVINVKKQSERNRLNLFHELGHLMMSIPADVDDKKKENLCNVFANEMLITKERFIEIFGTKCAAIYTDTLISLQREYGISPDALMMKAKQLGVITPSRHKYFHIKLNQNKWLRDMVHEERYPKEHPTRFQMLVFKALDEAEITISKAAAYLDISVADIMHRITYV